MNEFASRVLEWFAVHGRGDLPWQREPTPYRVWVSEIMLQQTQVATVIPYYERFMRSFPDVQSLANADVDSVLQHWSGLGYYARARNLHKAARVVRDDYGGAFPESFDDVHSLPGIGRSTAGAVLALSRGKRFAILDGNVKRVLARYHAIAGWPGKTAVARELWEFAETHTPHADVASYTQAMMDLGATVCTRTRPRCDSCPLNYHCTAHVQSRETEFPGRREKKARPLKTTTMVLVRANGSVYLERRPPAGIWGGLWSFPELGTDDNPQRWCERHLKVAPVDLQEWQTLRHSFSHFDLDIRPVAIEVHGEAPTVADNNDRRWHNLDTTPQFGLAAPVAELLTRLGVGPSQVTNS